LTIEDNIRLIWEQRGVPRHEQDERLPTLLGEFGLEGLIHAKAETLSGGERRRVEIARAIATEPAFLLLDEPFTGIDPIAVADIQAMIRQLRDRGLGVLITDHQVRETLAIVDRAYILNEGKIEVSGTADDVLASPVARKFYLGEGFRL
jgi:lipopolysaccharide export system ATP-binding protein